MPSGILLPTGGGNDVGLLQENDGRIKLSAGIGQIAFATDWQQLGQVRVIDAEDRAPE